MIPTRNEARNLGPLVRAISGLGLALTVFVLDDASPDGTPEVVASLRAAGHAVELISRTGPRGRGHAGREGLALIRNRGYDAAIEMDGDLSHDPLHIPALLAALGRTGASTGADLVLGSRFAPGGLDDERPPSRRVLSRCAAAYCRFWLGSRIADPTSGYRAYNRRALEKIPFATMSAEGPAVVSEILAGALGAGLRIAEVPIRFRARGEGLSKLGLATVLSNLIALPRLAAFARRPFP